MAGTVYDTPSPWDDIGVFVRDLFGAEPDYTDPDYDPENWTEGFWDDFVENIEEEATKFSESATNILGDVGDIIDGDKATSQNAYLQFLANSFTDYQRIETQKYNSLEADRAYDRQKELLELTQKYNSNEAELNRQWLTEQSNTSYQRAFADMRDAGLNPYLAYAQGGAPMTSSQSASVGVSQAPTASSSSRSGASASVGNTAQGVVGILGSLLSTIARLF